MDNSTIPVCPYHEKFYETWRRQSLSIGWTDEELLDYACSFWSFKLFQRHMDNGKWIVHVCGGLVGVTSSILALWTFANREFDAVSFMYHRLINLIELPMMALMIERAVRDYTSPSFLYSHAWATFFAVISAKIDNIFPTMVNIITLFISFERAVACLAPTHFSMVNRPRVVYTVAVASFLISVAIWAPSCFAHTIMYDNRTQPVRYMPVWTEWGKGAGYRSYNLIRHSLTSVGAMLMIMATCTAVVGLRRTAARSLRRYSSTPLGSSNITRANSTTTNTCTDRHRSRCSSSMIGGGGVEYWYLLKQLSYLQLCETIPLILLHILLIVADSIHWDYKGGGQMAPLELSYGQAMNILSLAETKQKVVLALEIANVCAHCLHFYWYLLLCPKVRRGFLAAVRRLCSSRRMIRRRLSTNNTSTMNLLLVRNGRICGSIENNNQH